MVPLHSAQRGACSMWRGALARAHAPAPCAIGRRPGPLRARYSSGGDHVCAVEGRCSGGCSMGRRPGHVARPLGCQCTFPLSRQCSHDDLLMTPPTTPSSTRLRPACLRPPRCVQLHMRAVGHWRQPRTQGGVCEPGANGIEPDTNTIEKWYARYAEGPKRYMLHTYPYNGSSHRLPIPATAWPPRTPASLAVPMLQVAPTIH